jgi:hypothetical protein
MQFTMRDLFFVTALVSMGLAWCGDHRHMEHRCQRLESILTAWGLERYIPDKSDPQPQ